MLDTFSPCSLLKAIYPWKFSNPRQDHIAAVSIGLITAFDLGTKSNNMTDAWRHLTDAAIRYNKRLCNKEAVIDAYARGEKTIGNSFGFPKDKFAKILVQESERFLKQNNNTSPIDIIEFCIYNNETLDCFKTEFINIKKIIK